MQEMQEMRVPSQGQKGPLEEGMAAHFSILAWESHGQKILGVNNPWGRKEPDMSEQLNNKNNYNC